ncbi:MAG: hypothetical protein K2P59_11925, partial [Acetatifactor sp.]|nr:hypothetical protein [Acetatifactor sp.]
MKEKYIPIIQKIADDVRKSKGLDNGTIIGDYIFTVLQQECVVMMRPLRHQPDLDGFSTEKIIKGELKTVVFINTAKSCLLYPDAHPAEPHVLKRGGPRR